MEVLKYAVDNWVALTAIMGGLAAVLVSPIVWYRTLREKTEGAEIAAIAKNNAVMREEFAEMNKEMSDHRQRIKTLELLVLEKELNEKRLQEENRQLKAQLKKKETRETQLIKETAQLTDMLERCKTCGDE